MTQNSTSLTNSTAGYKPSLLLCYTLVYWNAFCLFAEITTLTYLPLIYIPTTYAPTFYLALQSIRSHAQGLNFDPERFKSLSRWTITLAGIWCLAMASHVYIWWSATMWRDVFLEPIYATCQPTFIMVYIAARYMIHGRNTRSNVFLSNDEESGSNAAIHNDLTDSPVHQESNATESGDNTIIHYVDDTVPSEEHIPDTIVADIHSVVFEAYRPSIFLLLVSMALVISITVQYHIVTQFIYLIWLQPYIFIISTQLYIVFRNFRDQAADSNFIASADLTFECTVVWLSTRILAIILAQGTYQWLSTSTILGVVETGLLLYFSMRYASSLRVSVKDQIVIDNVSTEDTATTASRHPNNSPALINPPIYLLASCIFLCILCIRHWVIGRMFILDYPSIILAYVPTMVIYAYSIFQATRPSHANGHRYVKAAEWSVGNSVIWTAVYAPTAVTWRWLPYLMVMYIAIKFIRDVDARGNQAIEALISLPPDDSNIEAIHS